MDFISNKRLLISLGITLLTLFTMSVGFVVKPTLTQAANVSTNTHRLPDTGRQPLPVNDGWASATGGTTGGSMATSSNVYQVSTRAQLVQALGGDNKGTDSTSKIIYIKGTIYGNQDASGKMLTCADYTTDGYSLSAYMAAYDPSVWGRTAVPSGPQEDARAASEQKQASYVQIYIPSNTTIIGVKGETRVIGANFMVKNVNNVIIRNLAFENASDCFPQWDPTDGASGNWNSLFDNISVYNATHVWIDHNSFTDAKQLDSKQPTYFGREYQQHDGECDITKGADFVTVSWNRFLNHDKTMLIGGTDSPTYDTGKLHVTLNDNEFTGTLERTPRARYGQVHVYNNYYNQTANPALQYNLGVGIASQIYDQNNYYALPTDFSAANIIKVYKGTMIHTEGDIVNGQPTDILAAYNAANPTAPLSGNVGWTPQYHLNIISAQLVPLVVQLYAGTGHPLTSNF